MTAPVAIIIPCYRQAHLLGEALASCLAQEPPPAEIIVVDDGSPDNVAAAIAAIGKATEIRLVRRLNGGLSAARNTGLIASTSPYLVFLDADDRLCPGAIAAGLASHAANPDAVFTWGGYRNMDFGGRHWSRPNLPRLRRQPYLALLGGNVIGMHATVMYRRAPLLAAGGFDENLRTCEDWDLYLRLAKTNAVASHHHVTADYRRHAAGMSRGFDQLIATGLGVLERHRPGPDEPAERHRAWRRGRLQVTGLNLKRALVQALPALARGDLDAPRAAIRMLLRYLPITLSLGAGSVGPRPAVPVMTSTLTASPADLEMQT